VGLSLGEIVLLLIVGIIVVGPRRLPHVMRTAGQWIARLRRMSMDFRVQSGIDDLIREEGLEQHLRDLRSLSRINVVETLMAPVASPLPVSVPAGDLSPRAASPLLFANEYPELGCDAYGAQLDDDDPYARARGEIQPVPWSVDGAGADGGPS
jgi:sec-independent protein translocase protein TatB